ncbi:MAG: hypothetical protein ACKVU4_13815 [Phycisphaerales bacterium]
MDDAMPSPDARGEFTLLCERCGYVVEGLPGDGPCPECGTPIADSLPDRRRGSPWQQRAGFASWLRTGILMLRHPVRAWAVIRIESTCIGWAQVNRGVAAALIAIVTSARVTRATVGPPAPEFLRWCYWAVVSLVLTLLFTIVLRLLTAVEHRGVRFFGARRGWRVTHTVADAVCAHASVGWLVAGVLFGAGAIIVDSGLARQTAAAIGRPILAPTPWLRYFPPGLGFFAGLLVFEFLVYFGVRHNRYANRSTSGGPGTPG